jgi:hypothetical protein
MSGKVQAGKRNVKQGAIDPSKAYWTGGTALAKSPGLASTALEKSPGLALGPVKGKMSLLKKLLIGGGAAGALGAGAGVASSMGSEDETEGKKSKKKESVKESADTTLKARLKSFDYGMDLFFKQAGIEKAAVAQAVGLEEHTFAPHAAAWLKEVMTEANK